MRTVQVQAGAPLITSSRTHTPTTHPTTRRRRPLFAALAGAAALVYAADQLTKAWASSHLQPDRPRDLIGSVLQLNLTRNSGAAFSIGTSATWILTAIACAVVVVIVVTARRLGSRGWAVALGLLLGGALGNLTDRMVRAPGPGRGHVVDFLQLPRWPIFNIADSAIVTAAVLIGLLAIRGISVDGTRAAHQSSRGDAGDGSHDARDDAQTPHDAHDPARTPPDA